MAIVTKEDIDKFQKQLDTLRQQQREALDSYAQKAKELSTEIKRLEGIKANLDVELSSKFNDKLKQLQRKDDELQALIQGAHEKNGMLASKIKEAEAQLQNNIALEDSLRTREKVYFDNVQAHVDFSSKEKDSILVKNSAALDKETYATELLAKAERRMKEAEAKEASIVEQADKLTHISNNAAHDIAIQKDLQKKNETLKAQLEEIKTENQRLVDEALKHKAESIKIRDDCDQAQLRITRAAQEIARRNDECKAREIKAQLFDQQLKDRKSALDGQEGRLNELKNNVNALLEKQQAAQAASKEGA